MEEEKNKIYKIIGKIESVEEKLNKKGDPFKKIIIQGMTFNVFDSKWFEFLHVGKVIEASYNKTESGGYTYKNIFFIVESTEDKITNNNSQTTMNNTKNTTQQKGVDWDAKDRRIVKQNVLNRAVDMYVAGKIKKEEILPNADVFLKWVYDELDSVKETPIKNIEDVDSISVVEESID